MSKQRHVPSLVLERIARSRSKEEIVVIGIDEVGTGALAGPVVVGAVAFEDDEDKLPVRVRDSKLLNSNVRLELLPKIMDAAILVGIGISTPQEIDDIGMGAAREKAIIRAFKDAKKRYTGPRVVAVVDGRNLKKMRKKLGGSCAVFADRADQKSYSVAAASIVAKVTRDTMMIELSETYKGYGFETNMGYGTNQHLTGLTHLGPCKIHRMTTKPVRKEIQRREDALDEEHKKSRESKEKSISG